MHATGEYSFAIAPNSSTQGQPFIVPSTGTIPAAVSMRWADNCTQGKRFLFRLHEIDARYNLVLAHHPAREYMDTYLEAAEFGEMAEGAVVSGLRSGMSALNRSSRNWRVSFVCVQRGQQVIDKCNQIFMAETIGRVEGMEGIREN